MDIYNIKTLDRYPDSKSIIYIEPLVGGGGGGGCCQQKRVHLISFQDSRKRTQQSALINVCHLLL